MIIIELRKYISFDNCGSIGKLLSIFHILISHNYYTYFKISDKNRLSKICIFIISTNSAYNCFSYMQFLVS